MQCYESRCRISRSDHRRQVSNAGEAQCGYGADGIGNGASWRGCRKPSSTTLASRRPNAGRKSTSRAGADSARVSVRTWPSRGLAGLLTSSKPEWRDMMLDAQTLADRYVAAWNEPDATKRFIAIAALWAPDARRDGGARQPRGLGALGKLALGSAEKNGGQDGIRFRAAPSARR